MTEPKNHNIRYARMIRAELADYIRRAERQGRDMTGAELFKARRHPSVKLCDRYHQPVTCPLRDDVPQSGTDAPESGTALPE